VLDESEYQNKSWDYAAQRVMSPPFRDKKNQDALWAGLQSGQLQVVATDHCCFTTKQKRMGFKDFRMIPNGTGGVEDRLAVLWTAGVNTGRLTKEEFVAVTSANIARILNVYPRKGAIAVGSDADIVIWDPSASKKITAKKQVSRIDYNVFEGFECTGAPWITLNRGRIAFKDGDIRAEKGQGKYIERQPFPAVHKANATWKALTAPKGVSRRAVTP
jgi:dihydropyrimidinase